MLKFQSAPDFEAPTDSDANNTYVVQVRASDGTNQDLQTITVTVTNANDPPVLTAPAAIGWWTDPALQNREGFTGALGPHYWTKDEATNSCS